ncbi:hypothetical protein BCR36DRAFT_582401 [Piromyces finnis]|uniref:Uncharacterized protein n=1 Tax=Piromyces finnis TaxID=1754191 RepID=A0A1Y1VD14_9FUNG|nr:hypothetical protein BCR36DRAFT_582401 [Piromyces finnis]|eukprot:ORX52998.1 hypothetical protein BCR36DRAFT_582401 [Piromyces finnis]
MKNLKFPTNLKNEQNDPAGLIYLEFTMINNEEGYATASTSSIDDNAINQKKDFNTMIGGKSIPEAWTLSQYLNFLKEYPIYKINEPLSFHQQLIMLNVSKTDVKKCIDISLDYEKTLWCWCYRLKQAIDLNTKNDTLDDDDPASSIYLSFLLQTVALFQQQKLKRYQLLFSF